MLYIQGRLVGGFQEPMPTCNTICVLVFTKFKVHSLYELGVYIKQYSMNKFPIGIQSTTGMQKHINVYTFCCVLALALSLLLHWYLLQHSLCLYINTYTSTDSALTLTLTLALSLLLHYHLNQLKRFFSSGVCALCPCYPGPVWPQRSLYGAVLCKLYDIFMRL